MALDGARRIDASQFAAYPHRYHPGTVKPKAIMNKLFLSLAALAALTAANASFAADAVTDAMQAAYAPYRAALSRTNGKSVPDAQQAMAQTRAAWQGIADRFAAKPPAPYDRDSQFAATLGKVAKVYEQASAEVNEGKLTQAHATLEDARELLAGLRHRNQVVTYSDHMNAYHAQMEHVLESGAKLLTEPQGSLKLLAQASVMDYLAQRLRSEAPAALLADAEFNVTLQNVEASMAALKAAAMAQDAAAIKDALPKLKPAYSKHFIKFG